MSDLYGDAFKDDKREERLYGEYITENVTSYVHDSSKELPASKSNNVSFMKVEDLPLNCRNILAVSETHICYSVTQKKNLLRIIDTQLGEKVILRGHEHAVLDLRFALPENGLLCSVDNGEASGKAHIIVWKKQEQGDWKVHAELPLRAVTVRPHPSKADLWLAVGPDRLGIFSAAANASLAVAADRYEALPQHLVLSEGETIVDATFSSSGRHLAVAVKQQGQDSLTHIRVYKVTEGQDLLRAHSTTALADFSSRHLLAIQWTRNHIVTVSSQDTPSNPEHVGYEVKLWHTELEIGSTARVVPVPAAVQTVSVLLPRAVAGSSSSGLANPLLECALSLEPRGERYLLLSSRRSSLVAVLAVNPSTVDVGLPLYHLTCLNLRAPVVSADVTTVLGQAHHSAEAGEHLEVSAYQEAASDAGQASIQQYHVLFAQLFDYAAYCDLPAIKALQGQDGADNGGTSPGMLIPLAALLEGSPTKQRTAENSSSTAATDASNSKGMTILSMLNSMQRSSSNNSLSNAVSSSALPSPGIVRPPQPVPTPPAASPATPANAAGKLLGILGGGSKKNVTDVPSATGSADGLPSFLLNTQPALNSSILDVLKAASLAKAAAAGASSPAPATPTTATIAPSTPGAIKPSASTPSVSTPSVSTPSAAPAKPAAKVVVPASAPSPAATKPSASVVAAAAESGKAAVANVVRPTPTAAAPTASTAAPGKHTSTTAAFQAVPTASSAASDRHLELLTASVKELQASIASVAAHQLQQQAAAQSDQQTGKLLQQAVRDLQAGQSKHGDQLLAAVRKAMEGESKRALDQNTASTGTMRVEMSEQILKELVPSISNKVRDSVRDTVRDGVRAQLPVAFRESFESGLLPAFEAGAQTMFQQLQGAFVQGMQGVMQEGLRIQSISAASNEKLEQEVRELRDTVGRLEGTIAALSETVHTLTLTLASGAAHQHIAAAPEAQPLEDAFSLLAQGRISEAVVRVLEDKDIAVTVSLLELLTPSQVASSCSHLERLCITQQLAADMSVNIPIEGIGKRVDWIKNLVLSLLSGKNAEGGIYEDPNYELHFKTMISVVLESISAAKRLIFSAQYDNGEDDALSSLQVPHSVGTDLQLLEYVIQSKM